MFDLNLINEHLQKELETRIEQLKRDLGQKQDYDPETILLDNSDLLKWLKISRRTAQHWRDQKYIDFIQVDSKVFYTLADVKRFLERHRVRVEDRER